MIYFWTTAYNASKTLSRALDSVLKQTYGEFLYYICDNGSTDGGKTRRIIEEYANYDARIIPFYNEKNHIYLGNEKFRYLAHNINDEDYFCFLDADDEYISDFLEQMLNFMELNHLDIAVCGSDFISVAQNNLLTGRRLLAEDLILEGNAFTNYFPIYYQFLRTCWGKLFKGKTLHNTILDINTPNYPLAYGSDTHFSIRAFRDAKRVGILAKSLHKYYLSIKSTSYRFNPQRIDCDRILHEDALRFLESYGNVSLENINFLYSVYFNAIIDTLQIIYRAQINDLEKIKLILKVFDCDYTQISLSMNHFYWIDKIEQLKKETTSLVLSRNCCRNKEGAEVAAEILDGIYPDLRQIMKKEDLEFIIMKMPEMIEYLLHNDYQQILNRLHRWFKKHDADNPFLTTLELTACNALNLKDEELFELLSDIKKKRTKTAEELNINDKIIQLLSNYPILKDLSVDLSMMFPHVIRQVIKDNYTQALDKFISIQDIEIDDCDIQSYIMFGQNLSAAAGNENVYIYFKKLWISYLIDSKRSEEVACELKELISILPNDPDLEALHKRLLLQSCI